MNYLKLETDNMVNGEGLRVVLWVSGCEHSCKGCHNPSTWDGESGLEFNMSTLRELSSMLECDYISGITLSGGDPLATFNRKHVLDILKFCKSHFPSKTVWMYTGYTFEQVRELEHMLYVDVLIDGRFDESKISPDKPWVGSSNQRVLDLRDMRCQ